MRAAIWILVITTACGSSGSGRPDGNQGDDAPNDARTDGVAAARTIFVIPMENESASAIYGDTTNAPYINNTLAPMAAVATMFIDELPAIIPSEPHYVWMEAGTNAFGDITFLGDADASGGNSTNSTAHLVTQLHAAGLDWVSYQEGITAGTCPISSIGGAFYAAKHDPFVFFQDVAGNPPSSATADCASHHKPYSAFAADIAANTMPSYVFITPNLCHDMHGAGGCAGGMTDIKAGDTWLSTELPPILAYASAHDSIVYLIWDEGSNNQTIPFLAFGSHVKTGSSATAYSHSGLLKSIEEQLGVPVLASVTSATDFAGMFQTGSFP